MRTREQGFSFIELILVILVIGILIAMTIPGLKETAMRKQIKEGLELADVAKKGVNGFYGATGKMPANNEEAAIPPADKIISQFVTAVNVVDGAVTLTFGNNAGDSLKGKLVTVRPAIVPGFPQVPISWICNEVPAPPKMEFRGENKTDIQMAWLPVECRSESKK